MRTLNILAVAGFRITEGDDSPYWRLIDAIAALPYTSLTRRAWDDLLDDDLIGRDIVICYSWGCASVFMALTRLLKAGKITSLPLLIIMAGVPRGLTQWASVAWSGGWTIPDAVGVAVCLQVNSVPTSYPIKNSGPTRLNILLTGIPGNDHVNIQDADEAHKLVLGLISNVDFAINVPPPAMGG